MQEQINSQSMLKVGTILRSIYRIDSYLSSGGFGNTYVATNIEFDERVAIKEFFMKGVTQRDGNETTVSVSNAENQDSFLEQREKFKKEARRLRRLNNPHIVSVHDLFEEHGTAYYVMDYVDGENLAERLKRTGKPMTEAEVNEILPQILDALKSVHDAGIWHLDLKPANIMVDKSGQVKLIDFGASKQLHAQKGGATTSTAISYTNGYAPREQMEQNYDKFGPWTDIYALGATLYNLLTARHPPLPSDIDDDTSEDKHLALSFPASVSESMKHNILWMIQPNRLQRPQNIDAIISDDEETIIVPSDEKEWEDVEEWEDNDELVDENVPSFIKFLRKSDYFVVITGDILLTSYLGVMGYAMKHSVGTLNESQVIWFVLWILVLCVCPLVGGFFDCVIKHTKLFFIIIYCLTVIPYFLLSKDLGIQWHLAVIILLAPAVYIPILLKAGYYTSYYDLLG